jgi:hypothetical protein
VINGRPLGELVELGNRLCVFSFARMDYLAAIY